MAAKPERRFKIVADNRKARFNYEIGEIFEAGIALTGSEVKSLRAGKASIAESYADARDGEIWLINSNIPEYLQADRFNHAPKRPRKLLLHKRQINKLIGAVEREGMTSCRSSSISTTRAAPRSRSRSARGKKLHDKRETREEARLGARARPAAAGRRGDRDGRATSIGMLIFPRLHAARHDRALRGAGAAARTPRCIWSRTRIGAGEDRPRHGDRADA